MSSQSRANSAAVAYCQSTRLYYHKDVLLEGMNLCQRHNDSIKRLASNGSGGAPFNLDAAWADIVSTCAANAGKIYTESWSTITIPNMPGLPFGSEVLTPGGIIYAVPYNHNKILKIDSNTDTVSQFGDFSSGSLYRYSCAVLAPNGFIYVLPGRSTNILKINPSNDTYTTFGDLSVMGTSSSKWGGACVAPNGCIYGMPCGTNKIIKINPKTDEITLFDTPYTVPSTGLWQDAVLSRNGCIYGTPRASGLPYFKIDPSTDTFSTYGTYSGYNYPWACGRIAPNEFIYITGLQVGSALKINPSNDNVSTLSGYSGAYGSVLAPNGCIYGIPREAPYLIKINPTTDSVSRINMSRQGYTNSVLAPNGYIYALPGGYDNATNNILKIDVGVGVCQNFKESTLLSPFLNKY